jgi:nicotinate-nucleotide adenylyltransferase
MTALAILGGTFDPVHNGHIGLAEDVRRALALPEVRLVPAGDPPHRGGPVASGRDRLAMLRLAAAPHRGLVVEARGGARGG